MATSFTPHQSLQNILSIEYFGPPLREDNINKDLRNSSNIITQNIENSVKLLMGNNETITDDIPMAVNLLLHRNYPKEFDKNGKRINKNKLIQISVPEIFLSKSTNFIDPPPEMEVSLNPNILKEEMKYLGKTAVEDMEQESNVHIRHLTTNEMFDSRGTLKGYVANFFGDEVEKKLYLSLRTIFQDNGEEYGLFQSYDLYDFGLLRSCCIHLKVTLKKDKRKLCSYDGKYKLQSCDDSDKLAFDKQVWLHENEKWKIWYDPNNGWIISQIQRNGFCLFGNSSINVQCPHKIEIWDDRFGREANISVKKSYYREKDLIAINRTRRSVFMVSCKRSLSETAIENSKDQLNDGWQRFTKWFPSSNDKNWKFIPLIYYEKLNGTLPAEYSSVEHHFITGMYLLFSMGPVTILTPNSFNLCQLI